MRQSHLFIALLGFVTGIAGTCLVFFFVYGDSGAKALVTKEFLDRQQYKQRMLFKVEQNARITVDHLDSILNGHIKMSLDAGQKQLEIDYLTLLKCQRTLHEMYELERRDSVLFEDYQK